jgi:hypothetical protein
MQNSIGATCQQKIDLFLTMQAGQTLVPEELQYKLECIRCFDAIKLVLANFIKFQHSFLMYLLHFYDIPRALRTLSSCAQPCRTSFQHARFAAVRSRMA